MLETTKHLIASQYEASLCTLGHSIVMCPDKLWNARVAKFQFCQVAFHTLFFADYYLESEPESLRRQPFHLTNPEFFADYEELQDREPIKLYAKPQIEMYLDFCRTKAVSTLALETEESLCAPAKFPRKSFSRADLHLYNIRHIQHLAAQLMLRLLLYTDIDIPWIGAGWREV